MVLEADVANAALLFTAAMFFRRASLFRDVLTSVLAFHSRAVEVEVDQPRHLFEIAATVGVGLCVVHCALCL